MIFRKRTTPNIQKETPAPNLPEDGTEPKDIAGDVAPIRFYGTSWCPDCRRARNMFASQNISYEWFDIDTDRDAAKLVQTINHGNRSVPTIIFPDGSILVEPSSDVLLAKLTSYRSKS